MKRIHELEEEDIKHAVCDYIRKKYSTNVGVQHVKIKVDHIRPDRQGETDQYEVTVRVEEDRPPSVGTLTR